MNGSYARSRLKAFVTSIFCFLTLIGAYVCTIILLANRLGYALSFVLTLAIGILAYVGVIEPLAYLRHGVDYSLSTMAVKLGCRAPVILNPSTKGYAGCVIGIFPHLRFIVINKRLLNELSKGEVEVLLAHEVAHLIERHNLKHVALGLLLTLITAIFIESIALWSMWMSFVIIILILYTRRHERDAAKIAANAVGSTKYKEVMKKIDELSRGRRSTLLNAWYKITHPDIS